MESEFYINAKVYGDNILYTGFDNGEKVRKKIQYSPSIFIPTNEKSPYKTLYGDNLKEVKPGSIKKTRDYIKQYESVDNFKIYGITKYETAFISDLFPDDVEWDISKIRACVFDIEVNSDPDNGGFSTPENPFQPIISIAFKFIGENTYYLLGYDDFNPPKNVTYIKCKDEYTLLKKFIEILSIDYPDVFLGWNITGFDIPYLLNRCYKILGQPETNKISPWRIVRSTVTREFNPRFNKVEEKETFNITGISVLDYLTLYKKYHPEGSKRESYALGFIGELEAGVTKVEYEGSLHKLYTEDKDKFYRYNLQDVLVVEKIDEACNLFELALTLAYGAKVNFDDIFHQTRMGDSLSYSTLKKKGIQIPHTNDNTFAEYSGGYVKAPIVGYHRWPCSVDATSLYPSIMMGFNISPETLVKPEDYTPKMREIISNNVSVDNILARKIDLSGLDTENVCLTPNGQFFRTDVKGFVFEIIDTLFNNRKVYKNQMLAYQEEQEGCASEARKKELKKLVSKYNSMQTAMKLVANSLYGSLGNKYFRFYDVRLAEAITTCGQLANQWTAKYVNEYFNSLLKEDKDFVIYMDTDSLFLSLANLVDRFVPVEYDNRKKAEIVLKMINQKIQPKIDVICDALSKELNMYKPTISYKLEKICSAGVFPEKKRYILLVYINEGVIYTEPKVKITGYMSSEIPASSRAKLKECYLEILNSNNDKLINLVEEFKKEFYQYPPEKIARSIGLNGLNSYYDKDTVYKKGSPFQVKGALVYNKLLDDKKLNNELTYLKDGDKIKCVYLKIPNPIRTEVISFENKLPKELGLHEYIDYDLMFEKMFLSKLKLIVDKIGVAIEHKNSIEDFF